MSCLSAMTGSASGLRYDGEAEADRRGERLGEGSYVHHPAVRIECLQRLQWPVDVAELGVVVIFDDRRVVALRPAQ